MFRGPIIAVLLLLLATPAVAQPANLPVTPFGESVAVSDQWLVQPLEILPGDAVPNRTFARSLHDFLICAGPDFQPDPDADLRIDPVLTPGADPDPAVRNNRAVASLQNAGRDQRAAFEAALVEFEAGLAADPQFLAFVYNAGRVALILGDRPRAIAYFERARRLLPEFAGVHINLGRAYALGEPGVRQEPAAVVALREGVRRNPLDRSAELALADIYFAWQRNDRAREIYARILRELPDSVAARLGLARLAVRQRDWIRARRLLESARPDGLAGIRRRGISRAVDYELALVYEQLGAYDRAARRLARVLETPGDPIFWQISHAKATERLARLRAKAGS